MEGAEKTLIIILSGALAVFLVLAIVAVVKIIQILNHLKSISEKAQKLADTAESVGDFFRYTAGPVAIGRFFANLSEVVFRKKAKKREEDDD